jgi:hypothetical protein
MVLALRKRPFIPDLAKWRQVMAYIVAGLSLEIGFACRRLSVWSVAEVVGILHPFDCLGCGGRYMRIVTVVTEHRKIGDGGVESPPGLIGR